MKSDFLGLFDTFKDVKPYQDIDNSVYGIRGLDNEIVVP